MRPVHEFKDNFNADSGEMDVGGDQRVLSQSDRLINEKAHDLATPELYEVDSYVRNLCFVWPDGRKAFFNYAYLIEGEFEPGNDINKIRLNFSSIEVLLEGYRLDVLFAELLNHLPRRIKKIDKRYINRGKGDPEILEISIGTKKISIDA